MLANCNEFTGAIHVRDVFFLFGARAQRRRVSFLNAATPAGLAANLSFQNN